MSLRFIFGRFSLVACSAAKMSPDASVSESPSGRYSRQTRFAPLGPQGQEQLGRSVAVIVGCGALGTVQAALLARAGVGTLRLVDRDYVETSNLQRQLLYTEADAEAAMPKAEAARRHLVAANSGIAIEAHVSDLDAGNAEEEMVAVLVGIGAGLRETLE